jgi:hypothetical protein
MKIQTEKNKIKKETLKDIVIKYSPYALLVGSATSGIFLLVNYFTSGQLDYTFIIGFVFMGIYGVYKL